MMIKELRLRTESLLMIRFVLPLLIVLIMSLVVGALIYTRTSAVLGDEVKTSNRLLLEQGMNVLDKRWEAIDAFIRRITEDSKIARLQQIEDPFSTANLYHTIEARSRLQEYYSPNELVSGYYILFKRNGLVLNNEYTSRIADFAKDVQYSDKPKGYIESMIQTYHYRDMLPQQQVMLKDTAASLLTYMRSFGYANHSNGTVLVLIPSGEITKLFNGFETDGGWAYIADKDGNRLTSVAGPNAKLPDQQLALPEGSGVMSTTIGGSELTVTYATSAYNGWKYVAAQPSAVVLKKITYIKETTVTIFVLFLLLGGLTGVYMAYRNSRPVRSIIQILSSGSVAMPVSPARGAFGMIHQGISLLMDSHRELQDKMDRQLPFLRAAFFERLLRGQYQSDDDMEAVREHVRIEWTGERYLVAVATFPNRTAIYQAADIERLSQKKLLVRELMNDIGGGGVFVHDVDEDKLALLLQLNSGEPGHIIAQADDMLKTLQYRLQQECGVAAIISAGNPYARRMDISRSFLEAQQALIRSADNRIVWFKELLPNPSSYYYPESTETRLINLVRTGNVEALRSLLEELYQHNFTDHGLPVFVLKVFVFDVLASCCKISAELGEPAVFSEAAAVYGLADHAESIEAYFLTLKSHLEAMCADVNRQHTENQQRWFRDILAYVNANYSDGQLSLAMLAERFHVTETHLSRMFKEKHGINFFDYLETLRIEHSKRLLLETGLAVGEIALSVGYSSSNTFGRAFKRTVGISAMAFRQAQKPGESKN